MVQNTNIGFNRKAIREHSKYTFAYFPNFRPPPPFSSRAIFIVFQSNLMHNFYFYALSILWFRTPYPPQLSTNFGKNWDSKSAVLLPDSPLYLICSPWFLIMSVNSGSYCWMRFFLTSSIFSFLWRIRSWTGSRENLLSVNERWVRLGWGKRKHTTHLSKGTSGLKQICSQFLTLFLGTVFHVLSHGVIYCVSSKNLEMEVSDWLLKNFNH